MNDLKHIHTPSMDSVLYQNEKVKQGREIHVIQENRIQPRREVTLQKVSPAVTRMNVSRRDSPRKQNGTDK